MVSRDLGVASGRTRADGAHRVFGVEVAALVSSYPRISRHLIAGDARDRDAELVYSRDGSQGRLS